MGGMNTWRKSSHSGYNGNCAEVGQDGGSIGVRDTKDTPGPVLAFSADAWRTFTRTVAMPRYTVPRVAHCAAGELSRLTLYHRGMHVNVRDSIVGGEHDLVFTRPWHQPWVLSSLSEHDLRDLESALAQRRAMASRCTAAEGEHTCGMAPGHGNMHLCRACTHVWQPR